MQLASGYFGLVARASDTRLPSVCEKDVDYNGSIGSDTHDSDRSTGSHGHHSRHSGSRDSNRSHGHRHHGHHSRGSRSSRDNDSRSHSHRHIGPGSRHHRRSRHGHSHGQYPQWNQNPYSSYYPRPRLPDTCEQPETTVQTTTQFSTIDLVTTATETTPCDTHPSNNNLFQPINLAGK